MSGRDTAAVRFSLNRRASVTLEAVRTAKRATSVAWKTTARLTPGLHELTWTPDLATPVGSYVMRLTIARPGGIVTVLGRARPYELARQKAPVVRVLGVEAAFLRRSYLPGEPMELRVMADAAALSLQFLRIGWEDPNLSSDRNDEMVGAPKGDPVPMDWTGKRSSPATISIQTGMWPSGLYAARLTTDDGRVGFAPFVLRPRRPAPSASSSSCRRTRGRPTTCTTATATAGATRGTRAATRPSTSPVPTATAASRPGSAPTTAPSCAGSDGPGGRRTWWPRTISRSPRRATTCVRSTTSSSSPGTAST